MAINESYTQSAVTVGSSEYYLGANATTASYISTDALASLMVDVGNMAAGDEYEVALNEKVTSGGTQRRIVIGYLVGAQTAPFIFPHAQLMHSWDFSLKKIAGSDRAFSWSIRTVT